MVKFFLAQLLALMVALQSFAAIADIHQYHQNGLDHLEFKHDHKLLAENTTVKNLEDAVGDSSVINLDKAALKDSKLPSKDCHHCCHCHTHGHHAILNTSTDSAPQERIAALSKYHFPTTSFDPFPLFRPPSA
ncbi:hypothetical protein MAH1_06380 [Sessilibacter sp. MAH1]